MWALGLVLVSQLAGCMTMTLAEDWSHPSGGLHVLDDACVVNAEGDRRLVVVGQGWVSHSQILLDPMPATFLERWCFEFPLDPDADPGEVLTPSESRHLPPATSVEGEPARVLGIEPDGQAGWVEIEGRPVRVALTIEPTTAHYVGIVCLFPFAALADLVLLPAYLVVLVAIG